MCKIIYILNGKKPEPSEEGEVNIPRLWVKYNKE